MAREIRFGARESDLAVAQTRLVMETIARAYPELSLRMVTMKTRGDLHPELPLGGDNAGEKDLFTGALEQALARNEVDLCVHSLKDMALEQNDPLPIVGMARRGDPRDMLILPRDSGTGIPGNFIELSPGTALPFRQSGAAPVGCSSIRRRIQLLARSPDITVAPIRGNVPTRLAKLDQGQFGALVLAAAGIERLGVKDRPGYYFSVRDMVPAAGQGVLALQGRRGEDYAFLDVLRDRVTEEEAWTERRVIQTLGGGCRFPAAAFARVSGTEIVIIAMYAAGASFSIEREFGGGRTCSPTPSAGVPPPQRPCREAMGPKVPGPPAPPLFCRTHVIEEISGDRDRGFELAESLARRLLSRGEEG